MERSCVLPTTQFAYRTGWVPVMHICAVAYTAKCIESGKEARIVQIDFSASCDRVNQQ